MKSSTLKMLPFIYFLSGTFLFGQSPDKNDSIPVKKDLKNTVRINVTNPMIFGTDCFMFGYERTIGNHQSFSINIGRFSMPRMISINTDSIKDITKDVNSRGFHLSGDYRFYLAKENKYNSPHGLYIGPYATYNSFARDYKLASNTESFTGELNADLRFSVSSIGFQLGYQFIFWNRVTLDMLMFGPGIAGYKIKVNLSTNLDPDEESELFGKINDALNEKIPGFNRVISPGTFEKTGSFNTTSLGFRYVVMLGFRF